MCFSRVAAAATRSKCCVATEVLERQKCRNSRFARIAAAKTREKKAQKLSNLRQPQLGENQKLWKKKPQLEKNEENA